MQRIFYFSGFRLSVFHWLKDQYIDNFAFDPDEDGIEKFKQYLAITENTPIKIIVDLIEEDFKHENIPHVNAGDRKAIIGRTIGRHYRESSDYFYHRVVGREKKGRKDDRVLYSVLTNPNIIAPWLKVMNEADAVVSGIWSLPLLSEKLFGFIAKDGENVLLVSQQVPSNLRQSFFKNGKFETSRSAVVNLNETDLGQYIFDEVEQTIRFLSNKRHIGFDERLSVHIICRESDIDKIKLYCEDSPLRKFTYHSLETLGDTVGCGEITEFCNGLYSYICKKQLIFSRHYGPSTLFKHYYRYLASKVMYASSLIMVVASIVVMLSFISEAKILEEETKVAQRKAEVMENNYNRELLKFETRLEKSEAMKSSVLLYNKIKKSKTISPQNFMIDISRIFTLSGMYDTEITDIEWIRTQSSQMDQLIGRKKNKINYGNDEEIKQYAVIRGFIRISTSSMKKSIKKVESIIAAFKNSKMIENVQVMAMPMDIRSKSSLENASGTDLDVSTSSDSEKGKFELKLIMKGHKA